MYFTQSYAFQRLIGTSLLLFTANIIDFIQNYYFHRYLEVWFNGFIFGFIVEETIKLRLEIKVISYRQKIYTYSIKNLQILFW